MLSTYPNNGLVNQIETGTRSNGNGTVEAYFSYLPNSEICKGSIYLTFYLVCDQQKAVFCSEISWSDGKTIDEVVVCQMYPDCLEEIQEKVGTVVERTRTPLVDRIVVLLDNFCQG